MIRRLLLSALLLAGPAMAAGPFDPFGEATIVERPGAAIPIDLPLRDAAGRPTTLRKLASGRPLLLAPVLHDCPNLCGVTLGGLATAVAGQRFRPGRDVTVAAFGIDPAEGPDAARRDLGRLDAQPKGTALAARATVGSSAVVRATTDALGYRYAWDPRIGQYAHVAGVAVLTPDGRLVRWLYGLAPAPADVSRAIADARDGTTGSLGDQLLLLCYHYDPATGTYSFAIERVVRWAGLLTVLGLGLLVWRLKGRGA